MRKENRNYLSNLLVVGNNFVQKRRFFMANVRAIVVLAVFLVFAFPGKNQLFANQGIEPGKKKATLVLSDGSIIELDAAKDTTFNAHRSGVSITIDSTGIRYVSNKNLKDVNIKDQKSSIEMN